MADSVMLDKAKDFAVQIVNTCKLIKSDKKETVMTNQLLRSGTSIGANIHESKYAHSKPDFISKMQIALKECYESEYWLELLYRTNYIEEKDYKELANLILTASKRDKLKDWSENAYNYYKEHFKKEKCIDDLENLLKSLC